MTSKQRLITTLSGKVADCVPVSPDISNMVPARLTGKPFWDLYLYNDKPIWEAYIDAAKYFNFDALMDGYFPLTFDEEVKDEGFEKYIVFKNEERIVTQRGRKENNNMVWEETVDVYYIADSPSEGVNPALISLPATPDKYEKLEGVKPVSLGEDGLSRVKSLMGDQGLVGVWAAHTSILESPEDIYYYYDNPQIHEEWRDRLVEEALTRFNRIMSMKELPDFICVGGSGTLIYQTVDIFRNLCFPAVKAVIEKANKVGMPTHVHSCGPEKELVKIFAEETSLSVIDPLEISPMGDCDLKELKKLYGDKITLKGNLHTTDIMLNGSKDDVINASKKAIDDAAEGGRFILSTGDQCGRDTPDENIFAMVETAREYGKY